MEYKINIHMKNIFPHLDKNFLPVCEEMFLYHDGHRARKNRRFLKALWQLLHEGGVPSNNNFITVEDVVERIEGTLSKHTKRMMRSNIKRGGWQWLEGENGNIFGAIFVNEYIRRCELIKRSEMIEIEGKRIDRINHSNSPELYPDSDAVVE